MLFDLTADLSYPEIFQYIKELWIVALLGYILIKFKDLSFSLWIFIFTYLLLDDSLSIHEMLGEYTATNIINPLLGSKGSVWGELLVSVGIGVLFLALIIINFKKSSPKSKLIGMDLILLLSCLAFFGVFVDVLHVLLFSRFLFFHIGLLEDGGEMVTISVITWYVFLHSFAQDGNDEPGFSIIKTLGSVYKKITA
jgi:hypothetical protein